MSRKAIKLINWAALAERIPESEKAAFTAFKAKSDQYLQRMMAQPEAPPAIDWEYYKKNISADMVDRFQKQYESLSVPYPADKYTADIDAEQKQIAQKLDAYIQNIDTGINELHQEISNVNNMLPIQAMTLEDYVTLFPDGTFSKEKVSLWPHIPEAQDDYEANLEKKETNH